MSNDEIRTLAREISAELNRLQNRQLDSDYQRTLPIDDILKQWRPDDERDRKAGKGVEAAQAP